MNEPSYFLSTVDALTYSLREQSSVSVHDLLDAYATFTNRVASHAYLLQTCDTPPPALALLKTHKDDIVRALRRDVRRALIDPLDHFEDAIHHNIKIISKQHAIDASWLCHHALSALTTIFRFPAFYSAFSGNDLSSLFGDVLEISLADYLPGFKQTKTLSLSLCALSCHRLPLAVLSFRRDDVFSVLQRSLDNTRQPANIVGDGLKVISHTIQHYQSAFLLPLSPLLPHVMRNVFCESYELRSHASIALGKFANALISQSEISLTTWQTLSNHIISFLESYCNKSQETSEDDTSFSHIVRATFSVESPSHPRLAPAWILAVLASLIIICGPALYEKPTVLRFIIQSLAMALTHKRSVLRALHPHVWRCLVWIFSQMLLSPEGVEPAKISLAFHVIKQEVSGGIGIALANVLLSERISAIRSDERAERVSQALSVIKAMVQTECKHTRLDGFMFLQAFSNDAQVRHQITQNMYEIPAPILFNGAIIGAEWDNLPSIIHSIPKIPIVVHWLEESEIPRHSKTLLVIWKHFAIKVDKDKWDSSLVDVWLSILRACSRQLESGQHVPTTEVLRYSAATIVEFLPSVPLGESQPNWGSWNIHDQLCRLGFIDKLWSAMQQAFVSPSLEESAELILTSILQYPFHVLDLGVRTLWGTLCVSLMVTAPPSFLRDIHDLTEPQLIIRSQRELWGVVATSLSSNEPGLGWKELVKFLAIPICSWVLSNPELEAWETLLRNAITASGDSTIVAEILQCLQGKEVENWESVIPMLGFLLTSTHERGNSPSDELLSVLNTCLTVAYGRAQHSSEALACSLGLLNVVRCVTVSDPGKMMCILHALSSSLCLWIEDHTEVMSDAEFNSVAVPLYCETLKSLEVLPPSMQSLQDMEHFLASAFSRIPTPAIAPFAFEIFWRATYHGRSEFSNILPPKIKSCLICFVAAYGGDLADGLSLTTESQSQSINDYSQARFPTSRSHQVSGEVNPRNSPLSASIHAAVRSEVIEMDATFLDDEPTVLRQLQEYSSRMDEDESQGSVIHVSPPRSAMASSPSPEKILSIAPIQKRKTQAENAAPRKRSRTTRATLRAARKFESEPATRDVTPINVPHTGSQPLKKRVVFDGVQVPTIRAVRRHQRAETSKDTVSVEQDLVIAPKSSSRSARTRSRTSPPTSVGSDEDNFNWEDLYVTRSEIDVDNVDQSLAVYPSSPSRIQASAPHNRAESNLAGSSLPKAMSQNEISSSAPPRPSLRRAKTTSARLDALRDVYSAVANGASQIPMSELLQATRLVHQIGAVLTDQMGKKMGDR